MRVGDIRERERTSESRRYQRERKKEQVRVGDRGRESRRYQREEEESK